MSAAVTEQVVRGIASEVREGDAVAKTKAGPYEAVAKVEPHAKRRRFLNAGGQTIVMPGHDTKVWIRRTRDESGPSADGEAEAVEQAADDDAARRRLLKRAGLSENSELTQAQERRVAELAGKRLPASLTGGKLAEAIQKGRGMPGANGGGGSGKGRQSKYPERTQAIHKRALALTGLPPSKGGTGPVYPLTIKQAARIEKLLAKAGGDPVGAVGASAATLRKLAKGQQVEADKARPIRDWIKADAELRDDKTMYARKAAAIVLAVSEQD